MVTYKADDVTKTSDTSITARRSRWSEQMPLREPKEPPRWGRSRRHRLDAVAKAWLVAASAMILIAGVVVYAMSLPERVTMTSPAEIPSPETTGSRTADPAGVSNSRRGERPQKGQDLPTISEH
jgi:hypothetical protein